MYSKTEYFIFQVRIHCIPKENSLYPSDDYNKKHYFNKTNIRTKKQKECPATMAGVRGRQAYCDAV